MLGIQIQGYMFSLKRSFTLLLLQTTVILILFANVRIENELT